MVTISSFSDRTNFLNFKHSVSEPANFDFVSPFTQTTFFSFVWGGGGGGRGKQQYCVWKSYSVSALLCILTTEMLLSCFGFIVIVRHSMQVYNYFLIKTQCVLCFYKRWLLVWLGVGRGQKPVLPHSDRPAPLTLTSVLLFLAGGAPR